MGEETAFGYEQEDGIVIYVLSNTDSGLEELIPFIDKRTIDTNCSSKRIANSVEEYFSDSFREHNEEDTRWRILYKLDGTTLCRAWVTKYDIVFVPRK
jgi:hypothetical protein